MGRGVNFREETERSTKTLRLLTEEPEPDGDEEAASNVAIPMLVSALRTGPAAAADAAWGLANLTSTSVSPRLHPVNRAVFEAGGIAPLVALLGNADAKTASAAAMALQNLTAPASHRHSNAVVDAVFIAIIAVCAADRPPPLDNYPYLCERVRSVAVRRLQRAALGSDALALRAAIENAVAVDVKKEQLASARERLSELQAAADAIAEAKAEEEREERLEALGVAPAMKLPEDFCCPLTMEKMADPVCVSDGHTYEREAIMMVLGPSGNKVSPLTREPLMPEFVVPNYTLLKRIRSYDEEMIRVSEYAWQAALDNKKKAPAEGAPAAAVAVS